MNKKLGLDGRESAAGSGFASGFAIARVFYGDQAEEMRGIREKTDKSTPPEAQRFGFGGMGRWCGANLAACVVACTVGLCPGPGVFAQSVGTDTTIGSTGRVTGETNEGSSGVLEVRPKRVKPPKPGTRRLINIQIDPAEQAARLARGAQGEETSDATQAEAEGKAAVSTQGQFVWFWEAFSPDLEAASAGRLEPALELVAEHTEVPSPRLQLMQDIVSAYGVEILTGTIGTQVSPAWVLAVIAVESSGRADAVSPAGAEGLMQLMPQTAADYGVENPMSPKDNIAGGVRFFDLLMSTFGGDPLLVAAAYNAGAGAVRDHGGVPPYAETRDYVPKILAAYQIARSLCRTQPVMISDGCVFQTMN